jgi:translation elongation factor EF-1alpha
MSSFLKKVGYKPENVPFIPISGWEGDNLQFIVIFNFTNLKFNIYFLIYN